MCKCSFICINCFKRVLDCAGQATRLWFPKQGQYNRKVFRTFHYLKTRLLQ